ncbi:MAG TPA: YdeI/OmpD-associated family protein [Pseudonocardiaceae bacterium]|nr:YdeI/OmpD-associated family protein [Pseudonocardiaceae bacterium]
MRFHGRVALNGKTATGIEVPPEVVEGLNGGKRPAVTVTLNGGYTYRSTIGSMGGRYLISVSADVRGKAGVAAGDEVDVDVELDTAPREVTVPADLAAALDADPVARRVFDGLSYSHKQRYVLSVEDAKTPQTRQRRIGKTIETLKAK